MAKLPRRTARVWRWTAAAVVLAAGLAVVPAVADTPASMVGAGGAGAVTTLEQLVGKLNSESIAERQAAGDAISSNGSFTLSQLEAMLKRPGLPVESRLRLLPIARARFDEQPRAALGVEFDLSTSRSVIRRTIATFPAHGILQPGDEIVSVEGQRVATTAEGREGREGRDGRGLQQFNGRFVNQWGFNPIRPHIVCRDPGTKVRMQIIRRGPESLVMNNGRNFVQGPNGQLIIEPDIRPGVAKPDPDLIEIEVPLGRFSDLANTQPLTVWDLTEAWRLRMAGAMPGAESEPIASGLAISEYGISSLSDADRPLRLEQRTRAGHVIPITAGGEAHPAEQPAPEANLGRGNMFTGGFGDAPRGGIAINNRNVRAQVRIGVGGEVIDLTPMGDRLKPDGKGGQSVEQLDALIRTAEVMSREVDDYDQKLREPAMDDMTRRRLETARQAAKERLARYIDSIDAAKAKVLQGDK